MREICQIFKMRARQSMILKMREFHGKCVKVGRAEQKPTNKTKASEQKTTKATVYRAQKLLRGGKSFALSFLQKWKLS